MDKNKMKLYVEIAKRAENLGIYKGERLNLLMDIQSADLVFNLRLEDLLNADDFNFSHDVVGIVSNIDRSEYPATNFNLFLPRYSGK